MSVWLDSLSTAIYYFEGTASADGKTITQECSYDDPVRGPSVWRSVTRIRDENTLELEMFITTKGGKEEKIGLKGERVWHSKQVICSKAQ